MNIWAHLNHASCVLSLWTWHNGQLVPHQGAVLLVGDSFFFSSLSASTINFPECLTIRHESWHSAFAILDWHLFGWLWEQNCHLISWTSIAWPSALKTPESRPSFADDDVGLLYKTEMLHCLLVLQWEIIHQSFNGSFLFLNISLDSARIRYCLQMGSTSQFTYLRTFQ